MSIKKDDLVTCKQVYTCPYTPLFGLKRYNYTFKKGHQYEVFDVTANGVKIRGGDKMDCFFFSWLDFYKYFEKSVPQSISNSYKFCPHCGKPLN